MITKSNIERLDNLVKKYAMQDYLRANPPRRPCQMNRKNKPYSLSPRTNEAREMLALARNPNIKKCEEEVVKAYLLRMKMLGEED